jgi:hypothetical protein
MKASTIRANAPESERDEANLLKSEIGAEYLQAQRARANPSKKRGKALLKAEFKRGKEKLPAPIDDRAEYRAHILAHSLFPNVFNREAVMKYEASS